MFSYSCGYRKVFDDYTTILNQKYPDISIQGGNYDPPGYSMYLAKALVSLFVLMQFLYVHMKRMFCVDREIGYSTISFNWTNWARKQSGKSKRWLNRKKLEDT